MASRLANRIIFKGCDSPEGEKAVRELQARVRDSEVLINADEPVARFFELDADGPDGWDEGSDLPNVGPPSAIEKVFIEARVPADRPPAWRQTFHTFGIDSWGISLSYQDLIRYYSEHGQTPDARRDAHERARNVLDSHLSGRRGPQDQPSTSLPPYDGAGPAARWLLETELFLYRPAEKSVLAGAFGMDGVLLEDGSFAALKDGGRAIYYRTVPQAFQKNLGADSAQVAAAMASGVSTLYIPLLTTLCLTHHAATPPLSYLPGVAPSSGEGKGGLSSSGSWRSLDTFPVEQALEEEGTVRREGLRRALDASRQRFFVPDREAPHPRSESG